METNTAVLLHPLDVHEPLPRAMNDPFCYVVHSLCRRAAKAVAHFIESNDSLGRTLAEGKMLGVLVARETTGRVGFLAAYSGRLGSGGRPADDTTAADAAQRAADTFFVPPIYDARQHGSRFVRGEDVLAEMNVCIEALERQAADETRQRQVDTLKEQARAAIDHWRELMRAAKQRRDMLRRQGQAPETLVAESQWQKAELHRLRELWQQRIAAAEAPLAEARQRLETLCQRRRRYSDALQRWLFDQYVLTNAAGQRLPLRRVVALGTPPLQQRLKPDSTPMPPAATGDCCAPKLLQYAYSHGLQPLQIAEFWWKPQPSGAHGDMAAARTTAAAAETRHHGAFYPACHSRCLLILPWMLSGLDIEPPAPRAAGRELVIGIAYEDEHLIVVDKPAGLLSVPNDTDETSLVEIMNGCKHPASTRHPKPCYPVHRLDQDTSGLLLMVKDAALVARVQRAFACREVRKEYVAVVEGRPAVPDTNIAAADGWHRIDLPLRADIDDRPRQMVDHACGKPSATLWTIDDNSPDRSGTPRRTATTRLRLRPLTGRTHQLRVHCAHPEGLGCPIVGDRLYGHDSSAGLMAGGRLMLHACRLCFTHPVSGQTIDISSTPPF
ncbi:MAG: RluA family pseudouridine synthase [Prevotella sp.]|nr:RluA family pseudouridine synthase [Prevotella sp.]